MDIFDPLDDYRRVEIQILALEILQKAQVFNSTDDLLLFLFLLSLDKMLCS